MNVDVNEKQVIPYSHHYRCFPQMVGSVVNQAVFMYLLDEYLCRLRTGKKTEFVVSANDIAQKRNANWRTVVKSLGELQAMQLITMNNKMCVININKYIALIQAFHTLTKTTDKKQFIELLQAGDYVNLHKFGYNECTNGNEQLLMQEGGYVKIHNLCKNTQSEVMQKYTTCVKIHNSEDDELCKNTQPLQKYTTLCKNAEPYVKMHKVMQKYISILDEIRTEVLENYSKLEFIEEFRDYFLDFLAEEEFGNLVSVLFDHTTYYDPINAVLGAEFTFFLHHWGYVKIHKGLCKNTQGVMQKYITVNKEININKEESRNNEVIPPKEKEKDIFELDKTSLEQSLSGYQQTQRKQSLPFFPVNEVEEYIANIRNCLDRADKIYINQVWEIAHECFDQDAVLDEDGKEIIPANTNLENIGVSKERLMKDILLPAFDQTQAIIESGSVMVDGEELPVTAVIDNPEDFENIIDWEIQTILDGDNYIISTKRVRNIYAEQVEQVAPRSVKRHNREDDMSYMQKIVLIGDDDARYSQLTPIELVIYNFLNDHFQIGEHGEIEEPKHAFVNRTALATFYVDAKEKGVSDTDFLSVLSKDKPDGTGSLNMRQRMFSADKIRKWNGLHTATSIIDEFEINYD